MPRNSASWALSIYGHSQVHYLITPNLLSLVLNFGISTKSPTSKGGVGPLPTLRWNWGIQKPVLIPRSSHLESCWRKSNFFSSSVSFNMVGIVRENPHTRVEPSECVSAHFKVAIGRTKDMSSRLCRWSGNRA